MDFNIYTFDDIVAALQNPVLGEDLNFFINNDIIFDSAVLLANGITINLFNNSGNGKVTLAIPEGGVFRHFSTGFAVIDNVSLSINEGIILNGQGTGGGVQMYGSDNLLTLNGALVINCFGSLNGGGLLIQGNVNNSGLIINNSVITNCYANLGGGGFYASGCDIEINGTEIINNRAGNSGSGIQTMAGVNLLPSSLTINGSRISGNAGVNAFNEGGGINAYDTFVAINDSEIMNNMADNYGGGIHVKFNALTMNESALIINNSLVSGNRTRNTGGGIGIETAISQFTITDSIITENSAVSLETGTKQGGGIYLAGGSNLIVNNTLISRNEAGNYGGGIFVNRSSLILRNSEVSENIAMLSAGGIYGYQGANILIEENSKIIGNRTEAGGEPNNPLRGGGGIAMLSYGFIGTLTVTGGSEITGNVSGSYGGGIWTYPNYGPENIVNIQNAIISDNTANFGGGISIGEIAGFVPSLTVTDSIISNNTALTDGGGIIAIDSEVTVIGSEIINNTAGRDGGGIFTNFLENVMVDADSVFNGNIAGSYAFWDLTAGDDGEIHLTHIFTDRFSTFVPQQTPPQEVWFFTNAYNNYDINFVRPLKTFTVNFVDVNDPSLIIHSTEIQSFIGATVTVPPREEIIINNIVWLLTPPDQPAQTFVLENPEVDYIVTFAFEADVNYVVVREFYVDVCGCCIKEPTQTLVEAGGNYSRIAPCIPNFTFVGFRINCGPLQCGEVIIEGLNEDIEIRFIYRRNRNCRQGCTFRLPNLCKALGFGKPCNRGCGLKR